MSKPPVLSSRLRLLRDDVNALLERLFMLTREVQVFGGPRVSSHVDLRNEAVAQLAAIDKLLTTVAESPSAADWISYNTIYSDVAQINQEVLEIVQGLAIHKENVDEHACWIVRRFLEGISGDALGLTVFTARDLNFPTVASLTRVRFPVKSIWTLPFAAHQFANWKIKKDQPELCAFAKAAAEREVQKLLIPAAEVARRKAAEARAQSRWTQLISDALAVYFSGPCYAGSALLMRLNPVAADLEDEWQASELERAFVILETLRQMDVKLEGQQPPYSEFIAWLEVQWNEMLRAAGGLELSSQRQKELSDFLKDLMQVAGRTLSYAKYPLVPIRYMEINGSWSTAQQWSYEWQTALKQNSVLILPNNVSIASNVRDAFNAGWLCWSKTDDVSNIDAVAKAVFELCKKIVEPLSNPLEQTAETPGPPVTRAKQHG